MSVKIVILKSLEDVIAEVKEMISGENVVGYILENPYIVSFFDESSVEGLKVRFYPYAPLSKDTSIPIPCDWVVSIVEPIDEIKNSYIEKLNGKSESISN
jgi:hypothetical protein